MPSGIKGSYRVYNCLHCNKENKYGASKTNKFCNNTCQQGYQKRLADIQIEQGVVLGIAIMRRYVFDTRGNNCESCGVGNEYNNKPLTLQLDHIDGNSDNNSLINLQILCPNCHSQTDTYGSKGNGKRYKKITKRNTYLQEYKAKNNASVV